MRKIFILLVIMLGLSGCDGPTKSTRSVDDSMDVAALHFTSEGHKYILFSLNLRWAGVVHDPECECMVDYE